jgi:hypothetical protein
VDVRVASAFLSASSLRSLLDRNSCAQILMLELQIAGLFLMRRGCFCTDHNPLQIFV